MAMATVRRARDVDVVIFGHGNARVKGLGGASVLAGVAKVVGLVGSVGHSTFGHTAIAQHFDPARHRRVVIFTDDQQHDSGRVRLDHVPLIYTFNLAGYRPSALPAGERGRYTLGGFTDATFTAMKVLESGRDAALALPGLTGVGRGRTCGLPPRNGGSTPDRPRRQRCRSSGRPHRSIPGTLHRCRSDRRPPAASPVDTSWYGRPDPMASRNITAGWRAPRTGDAAGLRSSRRRTCLVLALVLGATGLQAVGPAGLRAATAPVATAEAPITSDIADNAAAATVEAAPSSHTEERTAPDHLRVVAEPAPGTQVSDPSSLVNDPTTDGLNDTQAGTTLTLSGGNVVAAYSDTGSIAHGAHFTGYSVSTDGGTSFVDRGELPASAAGDGSNAVVASDATTGRVYLASMTYSGRDQLQLFRSDDGGVTFGPPVNPTPNFAGRSDLLDRLWITVDNHPGPGQGTVYVVWRHFGGPLGGAIYLNRSIDGGTTWLPTDISVVQGYTGQGPFVTVAPDHSVLVAYHESPYAYGPGGKVQFRRSTDQGRTWEPKVTVANLRNVGSNGNLELWGGFRTNSFPQMAVNPVSGDIYMTYNDWSEVSTDWANVYFTVSHDHGVTWAPPVRVDTDPGISDQYMPSIAVTTDGSQVMIGFYDRRVDDWLIRRMAVIGDVTGSTVTFGHDFALSISYPPVVSQDPAVGRTYMGSSDQIVADDRFFYSTWTDTRDPHLGHANQPDVRFAKVPEDLNTRTSDLSVAVATAAPTRRPWWARRSRGWS